MRCIYTTEYYSGIKKNKVVLFTTAWEDLDFIILSEVSQTKTDIVYHSLLWLSHSVVSYSWNLMDCSTSAFPVLCISWNLLKLMPIESVIPSNHLMLHCPLLLLSSILPSIRVFSNESALCIRWPKYQSFSISPSSEYSGLISLRIYWLELLAVQGTLKNLLQQHSTKISILWHSAFFMVQLWHPYMTTGITKALTIQTDICQQSNISAF